MSNPQGPAVEQLKSHMGLQSCRLQTPDQHPSPIVRFHFTICFQLLSSSVFCEIHVIHIHTESTDYMYIS